MDYSILLDASAELGYRLAMAGAETFRIEESIQRVLAAYGVESEVFVIPNCLHVSIETDSGVPMTRMRRVGHHGNDLDAVERYNNLSRKICAERPDPAEIFDLIRQAQKTCSYYKFPIYLLGNFMGAAGFSIFFGGTLLDAGWAGICGMIVGLVGHFLNMKKVNAFFTTIASAFLMSTVAYAAGSAGMTHNTDTVIIGALMLLVPGLLFTNAMRDIIFGDTNSGTNRIVQVLLIAAAIALGTGVAWNMAETFFPLSANTAPIEYPLYIQCFSTFLGCAGFVIIFNIHGKGLLLCSSGGVLAWLAYYITVRLGGSSILGYFVGGVTAAVYSEAMARIRKYPAISYLVISIFPLIPGAGIYYTTGHLVRKDMTMFAESGTQTIAIAGVIAVGILMVSTIVRFWGIWKHHRQIRKELR